MNRIVAFSSRFVSAEPAGVQDEVAYKAPPVGKAFVGFTVVMAIVTVAALIENRSSQPVSDAAVVQLGVVGTTVFTLAGALAVYRAVLTKSPAFLPIVVVLLGPGALWCWLFFVAGTASGPLVTLLVVTASALVGTLLLVEGLWQARWLGVFCGLGAVGLTLTAALVQAGTEAEPGFAAALLAVLSGTACLYGTLVEIESSSRRSFEELLDAKRRIEAEIGATEEILHDLRNGLLAIETAMITLDDDVGGPLRTETARLRRLTAKRERDPVEFDLIPGVRDMVKARRASGLTIDLRVPTSAQVIGEESEVMAVIDNLLSNAIRHGADPINVKVEDHDGEIAVTVSDSGRINDDSDALSFFRRGFSSSSEGEGIGLDRARMLAELHHGAVVYEPGSDGETAFVFTIPNSETAQKGDPAPISWSTAGS